MVAQSAIDNSDTTGDIPRPGRYQESGHVGHILRLAKIAQWDLPLSKLPAFFAGEERADIRRIDEAWLQAVDPDAILPQLSRKLF